MTATATDWISVEDEMPEQNQRVIAYESFYETVGEAFNSGWWSFFGPPKDDCNVTHWMPLPDPPSE